MPPIYEQGNGASPAPGSCHVPEIPDPYPHPAYPAGGCHFVNCSHVDFAAKHVGRRPLTEVTAETRARNWHTHAQTHTHTLRAFPPGPGKRVLLIGSSGMGLGVRKPLEK